MSNDKKRERDKHASRFFVSLSIVNDRRNLHVFINIHTPLSIDFVIVCFRLLTS